MAGKLIAHYLSPCRIMRRWVELANRVDKLNREVTIALVGKYTKLEDSYTSVSKALQHASITVGYNLKLKYIEACNLERATKAENPVLYHEAWQQLCSSDGVIIPGGFGSRGIEGKIRACNWCRVNEKPVLGICLGLQSMVIEYARNVLNLADANSTEVDPNTPNPLVIDMPEHHPGQMGGTMRLGRRTTTFKGNGSSVLREWKRVWESYVSCMFHVKRYFYSTEKLYGNVASIDERHRHRYEVNPAYVERLEEKGLKFVGRDTEETRMEIVELENHPYYVGVQFHPEYLSRPLKPSPPFMGLILAAKKKLKAYLASGSRAFNNDITTSDYEESSGEFGGDD